MKVLEVNYDSIQKAMEDVRRSKHDYYLDIETGRIIQLPVDLMEKTLDQLYNDYDEDESNEEVLFDSELDISTELPEEVFDDLETAISVVPETDRYLRIPERNSSEAFECMKAFTKTVSDSTLRPELLDSLKGSGAFSKFKNALINFPKERKEWNRYNAKKMRTVVKEWLEDKGIRPIRKRGSAKKQ
jgi:hypothetical protein